MAAPTPAPPPWDWSHIRDLQPGDQIQHESRSPVTDTWMTVLTAASTFRHGWVVMVAEKPSGPYVVGLPDDNVRRAIPDTRSKAA
jgi:hypothetical protein